MRKLVAFGLVLVATTFVGACKKRERGSSLQDNNSLMAGDISFDFYEMGDPVPENVSKYIIDDLRSRKLTPEGFDDEPLYVLSNYRIGFAKSNSKVVGYLLSRVFRKDNKRLENNGAHFLTLVASGVSGIDDSKKEIVYGQFAYAALRPIQAILEKDPKKWSFSRVELASDVSDKFSTGLSRKEGDMEPNIVSIGPLFGSQKFGKPMIVFTAQKYMDRTVKLLESKDMSQLLFYTPRQKEVRSVEWRLQDKGGDMQYTDDK